MLQQSFAWLPTQGYTTKAGSNQKFPVVMSEIGSSLVDDSVRQLHAMSNIALLHSLLVLKGAAAKFAC